MPLILMASIGYEKSYHLYIYYNARVIMVSLQNYLYFPIATAVISKFLYTRIQCVYQVTSDW